MSHNAPSVSDQASAVPPATQRPLSKVLAKLLTWLKNSLRLSLYLPLALLMLLALMLGTPMGSHGAIILANKLIPGLKLEYQSGTLNREINLAELHYRLDEVNLDAKGVSLSWQPSCLLNWQVCIQSLSAEAVTVNYHSAPAAEVVSNNSQTNEAIELPNPAAPFEIPMAILLSRAKLKHLDVNIHDMRYQADEIKGSAIWNSSGLTVRTIHSQGLKVVIPHTSSTKQAPDIKRVEDLGQLALTDLPQLTLAFPIRIKNLTATDSQLSLGERQDNFPHIALKASMKDSILRVSALQLTHSDNSGLLSGQVDLHGKLDFSGNYPLDITADLQLTHLAELPGLANQNVSLVLSQDFSNLKLRAQGQGQSTFLLQVELALTTSPLNYQLSLSDSQFHWPLSSKQFQANIKTLVSTGNIHSQQLSLKADIISTLESPITPTSSAGHSKALAPQQIKINLDTELSHQNQQLSLKQLSLSSPAGQLSANAELNYDDNVQWQAKLETQNLQLQQLLPLFTPQRLNDNTEAASSAQLNNFGLISTNISGNLSTQGKLSAKSWQVAITQANLTGNVNGYPLTVSGDISADSQLNFSAKQLEAQALGAQLSINGEAAERWDVNAKLSVPDVSQWFNHGRGSMTATAKIDGLQANPLLSMQTELNNFSANGISLDYVQLIGSYAPKLDHTFNLQLRNNLLKWKKHQITDLSLSAKGDINQQSVSLITDGDIVINSELSSQYQPLSDMLNAKLARLSIITKLGQWTLDNPATLQWQQGKGSISPLCLVHPHSKLCLVDPINIGKQGQVNLAFSGNPGTLLAPILSKKMRWDGDATLSAQVHWQEGSRPTAKLNVALLPGNITLIRAQNNRISLDYQQLNLIAQLDEQALSGQLNINSEGIAQLQSQFTIANNKPRSLSGNIDVSHLNLQPFGEFFPQIATLEGIVSSKLLLAGTLAEPDISGHMRLNDGAVSVTSNPTLLDKIYLDLALAGQQGSLNGHWFMGKGEGKVLGTLQWPLGQFSGDLTIIGDSLAFIQPPLAILDVSPALALSFNRQQLTVTGDIDVPSGQIKIVPLAQGGIPVSDDVVFNDSISAQEVKTSPYAIVADLTINVGKELLIDGLGLTGKLGGKLLLKQQAFKPPLLYGDIKVRQGSYRFMGQSLKINTGEVQFVGSAENPNLNIQAVREIKDEDLTAGVRITGTPSRPVVTLFSTPAKEQAEILSYILKGTGFSSTNNQQNNSLMMSAALSLSSQFDGGAINSIGNTASGLIEKFGFSNVQLDANDEGRVALSGYIGENLMVKYGMGVFNPGYEMTVRYYLLSQLYLETVSGTLSQSLDLYYSFDID